MQHVVWEKLDDLMGNTQFVKADFTPYGSNSLAEQVSDAADLVQAAFAGVAPAKGRSASGMIESGCDKAWLCPYRHCIKPQYLCQGFFPDNLTNSCAVQIGMAYLPDDIELQCL